MPLVNVKCKKCGKQSKLDIENHSKEEIEEWLKKDDGFHCFGNHVELGKHSDYWVIDWNSLTEGSAPTEEEFLSELKEKFVEVYNTKEIQEKYDILGFSYGVCKAIDKETLKEKIFEFTTSPKGTRYYYA